MLDACAELPGGVRGQGAAWAGGGHGAAMAQLDEAERRTSTSLEASQTAIAVHIRALSDRLATAESHHQPLSSPAFAFDGSSVGSSETGGAVHLEVICQVPEEEPDPDERQRRYAEFIALMQKNLDCVSVHSWGLCAATRSGSTRASGCYALALVPSVALLVLQGFVLHAMGFEALHPSCNSNTDCLADMWCAPSQSLSGLTRTPGTCDDCRWASKLDSQDFDSLPSRYDANAYATLTAADLATHETLSSAVSHCETTDSDPDRCDFILAFHEQFTVAAFVVLVSTTCTMLAFLIMDMDKQAQIAEVFEHRITNVATTSTVARGFITGIVLLILNLRRFVLPGVVVYTYAALVLAPTPDASLPVSYVLNGLAIGLVYNVDALLAAAFLDTAAHALVIRAFADVEAHVRGVDADPGLPDEVLLGFHRFVAAAFAALFLGCILGTEDMMSSFRLDWDELPTKWVENPSGRSCTNVMTMLCSTAVLMAAFIALLWSMTRYASKPSNRCGRSGFVGLLDVIVSPVSVLVTMPVFSLMFLKFGHTVIE